MGIISNAWSLLRGLSEFFGFFRDFFDALPIVLQTLIYFSFAFVLLFGFLRMIRTR